MQDPARVRNIGLLFFASGVVAVTAAFALPGLPEQSWWRAGLFIYGSTAILFGGGTALMRHLDAQARERLARGEGVLARWRIEPEAWRAFVAIERNWKERSEDDLCNELSLSAEIPAKGIEVIAGRNAIRIGEGIHNFSGGVPEVTEVVLHDLHPTIIEMRLYYPGGGHGASGVPFSPKRSVLRFPVASGSWKEANSLVAHYRGETTRRPDYFHGPGDGSDPEDLSRCYHCGYQTGKLVSHCPECGRAMQSKRWSRRYGWVLAFLGSGISLVIGYILLHLVTQLEQPLDSSGIKPEERMAIGILALVLIFGLTALGYGVWQIITGRRSKWIIYFAVGLALVVVILALLL